MKTIIGKVLNKQFDVQIKKRTGGTYPGWRVTYQLPDGEVSTIEKHENTLKFAPSLKEALDSVSVGDDITIEMEKGDSGYWEVVSIAKGANAMPRRVDETPRGSYKTDRSVRDGEVQSMIVRQNCIGNAVNFLKDRKEAKEEQVFELAAKFEQWVTRKSEDKTEVE